MTVPDQSVTFCNYCSDPHCDVLYGYCHCMCGLKTGVSRHNARSLGYKAGIPRLVARFHKVPPPMVYAQPFKIDGEYCRLIPLSSGLWCIVSAHRYRDLMRHHWSAFLNRSNGSYYAIRQERGIGNILMHRYILGLGKGDPRTGDHRNHNTLDNRDLNLRDASDSQQQGNKRLNRNNTSGYKGVNFFKPVQSYRAEITASGKSITVGYFKDPALAARAYDIAAVWFFGEFAHLNFPGEALHLDVIPFRAYERFARVRPASCPELFGSIIDRLAESAILKTSVEG